MENDRDWTLQMRTEFRSVSHMHTVPSSHLSLTLPVPGGYSVAPASFRFQRDLGANYITLTWRVESLSRFVTGIVPRAARDLSVQQHGAGGTRIKQQE